MPDLQLFISDFSPDILCITETWLHEDISNGNLALNGYNIIRKDRQNGTNAHGGVLIAVKTTYDFISLDHESDHEVAFINLIINGTTLKIVVAYRPPSQTFIENQLFVHFLHDKL